MKIEITAGPMVLLRLVIFEVMEDLVVLEDSPADPIDGEDFNKKLRGDE